MLEYNFEEIREIFHYYKINEKKSNTQSKNRIKLRKLWEKEVEKKNKLLFNWITNNWLSNYLWEMRIKIWIQELIRIYKDKYKI